MGKKSFNKRRDDAAGSGQRGGGGPGSDPMEVDPPPAVTVRIERNALARQKVVLPSTVQKVKVPSFAAYIDATRARNPEEAIRALNIPDLRGIVSTNENPRLCAHCSAALEGYLCTDVAALHTPCGAMVCRGCFGNHCQLCTSSLDMAVLHVKTGAPWALYHYAMNKRNWKESDGHMVLRLLALAADAGHPHACHVLAVGHGWKRDATTFSKKSIFMKYFDRPQDISSAAKYDKRALVLDPDNYRESSTSIKWFLLALVKDGRLKEAKVLADELYRLESSDGLPKNVLDMIDSATCGPFLDQSSTDYKLSQVEEERPSTVLSVDLLNQHNLSPEELRLADYELGDGVLRMTFTALKVLSEQLATSSSPLLVGLGGLVSSMHQ